MTGLGRDSVLRKAWRWLANMAGCGRSNVRPEHRDAVLIFDSTDSVIGVVVGTRIFDEKGAFVTEISPTATIKRIRDVLLNHKACGSVV